MQAAAMRRVEGEDPGTLAFQRAAGKPRVGPPFGSVAVQHVDAKLRREARQPTVGAPIREAQTAAHGNSLDAERAGIGETADRPPRILPSAFCVADDADVESKLGLAFCQIMDVAKKPPNRRSETMEDADG